MDEQLKLTITMDKYGAIDFKVGDDDTAPFNPHAILMMTEVVQQVVVAQYIMQTEQMKAKHSPKIDLAPAGMRVPRNG